MMIIIIKLIKSSHSINAIGPAPHREHPPGTGNGLLTRWQPGIAEMMMKNLAVLVKQHAVLGDCPNQ
jgi:hypothetical protein